MTRAVKVQKFEALLTMLEEFSRDKDLENGDATVVNECIGLVRGRLKGLKE